nr:hypothetical protein [Micromonospora purpureochromogenes]
MRRQFVRLVTAAALLGGLLVVGAAPAYADSDRVGVHAASSFSAGGSAGGVSMEVRKRTEGCVLLRSSLGLQLTGLNPDQVRVQVNIGGRWFPVPVSGGGGSVATGRTSPVNATLCKGKSITVRYRVAFVAGAPAGRLEVVGEATTAVGRLIGRGADTSRVGGSLAGSPSTRKPTPTPTPSATGTPAAVTDEPTQAVLAAPTTGQAVAAAEESSGGSMIMWFGIALVAIGAGLIALLIRNNRKDRGPADEQAYPAVPLPRSSGPTTYRSGGGVPGATPAPNPQVYGQQPAPARPSGLYGGAGAYPTVPSTPRPSGGVYGAPTSAPPAATPPAPQRPATPPAATPPVPQRPATPPAAPPDGEATTFMPRLPG